MKVLMFGKTGQVAREVLRRSGDAEIVALGRREADLSDPAACMAAVAASDADVVLNAAAWTAVDDAEASESAAAVVNGAAPGAMAEAAAARGMPFIHISTDYVFSGEGETPWREDDRPRPISAYGWTKLAGEESIAAAGGDWVVLRTSWVFSAHGANFVKTMLRLSETRDELSVVDDQTGGPTPAASIADACLSIARAMVDRRGESGVYHFAGAPDVTWREFAEAVFGAAGRDVRVSPIDTASWPTPAARPLNSRLDCAKILRDYGVARPDWRRGLGEVVEELTA